MTFATGIFIKDCTKITFNKKLKVREDVDWLSKLIKKKMTFTCVEESLYYIRQHEGRLTKK
jgi:hypothetical protein